EAGTTLVRAFTAGANYGVRNLTAAGATPFFSVNDGIHGAELWESDGTAAGAALGKDITPGIANSASSGDQFLALGGVLYFTATEDGSVFGGTAGLWRSDGTEAGTFRVFAEYVQELAAVGGAVVFGSAGGLWRTDGTEAGTSEVRGSTYVFTA